MTVPRRIDGVKITQLQEERGWTNTDLARESNLSVSTIIRVKNNEAHNSSNFTVKCLAKAFGCDPAEFFKPEAIAEAINDSIAQTVSNVVTEAIAEAVTVVIDEVAPDTSPETLANTIPEMQLNMPLDLNINNYIERMAEAHRQEIDTLVKSHDDHLQELRKEKHAWQTITVILAVAVIICTFFHLR